MPSFGGRSLANLSTCHPDLQRVFHEVVKHFDCSVLTGHRDQRTQDRHFREGTSKVQWPNSKHNQEPSLAADVAPYPTNWADTQRFYYFAGFVMATAKAMDIELRFGGDWDGDTQVLDQSFLDLVHFELRG